MKSLAVTAVMSLAFASFNAQAGDHLTPLGNVSVPYSYGYTQTFTAADYNTTFFDDYTFTITGASANSVSTTINLGGVLSITNLKARLYTGGDHITLPSSSFPTSTSSLIMQDWGSTVTNLGSGISTETVVLNPLTLNPGTYTLQIKGTVNGLFGGTYSGVLNLAAVPETDTYAMLIAGLGVMGLVARRKSNKA